MNREIIELREVIGKLVPLLTGKGLVVTQRGAQAYVEVDPRTKKPRRVNIPNISDNATPDFIRAIQGFIDHEVAHVLITNWDDYLVKGDPNNPKNKRLQVLINIVEDTMIEREIVKIFPGSRKNIGDMRRHFVDKISTPAAKAARDDKELFQVILVPIMRALAGHEEFQEFMDRNKYWDLPLVKEFVDKLSPQTKALLPKMNQTKQCRAAAEEIEAILHPAPPVPVVTAVAPNEGSIAGGEPVIVIGTGFIDVTEIRFGKNPAPIWRMDSPTQMTVFTPKGEEGLTSVTVTNLTGSHTLDDAFTYVEPKEEEEEESDGKSQNKPDKKAGKGNGTGQRDHSESEGGEEGEEDEDAGESGSGSSGKNEDGKGKSKSKKDKNQKDEEDEEQDGDGGSEDDNSDDTDDQSAGTDSEGEEDEDQDGEGDGSGEDGEDGDDVASNTGPESEDEGAGNGDDDDGSDDGDDEESSGQGREARGDTTAIDDGEHSAGEPGNSGEMDNGGGVGGDSSGRSMLDFDDDAFENADISSQISIFITNEAVETISKSDYTVFTRELDRIEPLTPPVNMDPRWVPELEEKTRQMVGRMQKDIERMLASQSHIVRTPGWRSGRLHAPALHRLKTGDDRVFNRKQEHRSKDTAVSLLIDNSGSMSGVKIDTAMVAGYALSSTLERVNIAHEILGFTTASFWGLPPTLQQALNDELAKTGIRYSRTIPLVMPIYKSFEERVTPLVKQRIAFVQRAQQGLQGNVDGECLEYAAIRLMKRREKRKVMIVLSDGHPVNADNARGHLKLVVENLNKSGIETIGIGIMDDAVRAFYPKYVVLNNVMDLPGQIMKELRQILTN